MISPTNPKILVLNREGIPASKAKVFFFDQGTDNPKSVKYVEGGTLTNEITADDSGKFPQVELLVGEYTLKAFIPLDPKEPYPLFPEDYELLETWDLTGAEDPAHNENDSVATLPDLTALRNYDGDETKIWIGDRLFIKDVLVNQTDNNGTVIVSSALDDVVWRMDLTGYNMTSLDWFGADKSGATDSTAAILSAISAIYNSTSGQAEYRLPSTLYIPNGTYLVNSNISFTCEVYMESNVRFYNSTGSQLDLNFNKGLDTDKTDLFYFVGAGLSPVVPKFPQKLPNGKIQLVNLQWFMSDYVEISWFPYEVSFVGEGTINTADNTQHTINEIKGTGDLVLMTTAGKPSCIINKLKCAPLGLEVQGTGLVYFESLNITYLKTASDINRCSGNELVISKNWVIDFNANLNFSSVHGNKTSLTISNNSGVSKTVSATGDVDFESFTWDIHDLIPTFISEPKDFSWTNADSDDWNAYLTYGSNDFTGTTTSGDILISSDQEIIGLNHTGSFQCSYNLELKNSKISLSSGDHVGAVNLKMTECEVTNDSPSNGDIWSGDMRLVNSYITCPVYLTNVVTNMQLEMRGCRFTNQITVNQSGTLQTLVARNNEVAKADFIPYHFTITDFPNDVGISIDVSDNWTTDLSGQLVRTKGHAIVPGSGAGKVAIESFGFLDMIRPSGLSWAVWGPGETYGPFIGKKYIVGTPDPVLQSENGSATLENQSVNETQIYATFWSTQNWRSTGV